MTSAITEKALHYVSRALRRDPAAGEQARPAPQSRARITESNGNINDDMAHNDIAFLPPRPRVDRYGGS